MNRSGIFLAAAALLTAACANTVRGPDGERLTLVQPADQVMEQGETNKIAVTVTRVNFDGDIPISFDGLPSGVSIVEDDLKVPQGENLRSFTLHAKPDADVGVTEEVWVRAEGPNGMATSQAFTLTVKKKSK